MKICVFCSSSVDLDNKYYQLARDLAERLSKSHHSLIYGAGKTGLMGAISEVAARTNLETTGVIPEKLNIKGIVAENCSNLIVTSDMKERKHVLRTESDAFIAMPGGFGTLEEILEVITLKQLQYHKKPIVILNSFGFYTQLLKHFERIFNEGFADNNYRSLFRVCKSTEESINTIENYRYKAVYDKYLKR